MKKAVFFDRDGVLNLDKGYLFKIEDFVWQQDAIAAVKFLKEQGYLLVVVTNQSGVARGYYSEEDVRKLHEYMQRELSELDTGVDAYYYCPHLPEAAVSEYAVKCNCRKPAPGMILQAIKEHGIDVNNSFLVGDSPRDVQAAEAAGISGYLYKDGSLLEFVKGIV